jgi:hypothetical protein
MCFDVNEELELFRNRITEKTGCKNVALTIGERPKNIKLLHIPKLNWVKPKLDQPDDSDSSEEDNRLHMSRSHASFYNTVRVLRCRDSEIVFFLRCN